MRSVEVTNADFNGETWDGAPFKGDSDDNVWLLRAISDGAIRVWPADRDYAVWEVKTQVGPVRALPGDIIRSLGEHGPFEVIERPEKYRDPARLPKGTFT